MSLNDPRRTGSWASARRTFGGRNVAANAVAATLAEYFNIRRRVIWLEPARIKLRESGWFMGSLFADLLAGLFVNMRVQHADEGQIAVTLREIQAVADDKLVRYREPDVIGLDLFKAPRGFVE